MARRYNNRYDALEAVLMGTFDFQGVKTAKQIQAERAAAAKQKAVQEANKKKYVQLDNILPYDERDQRRLLHLQAIIDDPAAAPQEKESAARSIQKIKNKAKGGK